MSLQSNHPWYGGIPRRPKLLLVPFLLLLLVLSQTLSLAQEPFRFVVIGDTRPRFESEDFRIFEDLIGRINQRKPALVVNVGDLIYGYGLLSKEKQWNRYQAILPKLTVPYYQLPGNHDIFSRKARRIYQQRFGSLYYSFDHAGYHFVLLNNCDEGRWGLLGSEQFAWLQADLKKAAPTQTFVFMHFPVWEPERVKPAYFEFWRKHLHPLFRASGVRAVFGGHYHSYGPTREFDGIRYFITGGGGAELRPEYRKAGGEHHFLEVRPTPTDVQVRVVTQHGELSDAEADVMGGFEFADKNSSRIGINPGSVDLSSGVRGSLVLRNPHPEPLTGVAEWYLDPSKLRAEPASLPVYVAPHGSTNLPFMLQTLAPDLPLSSFPWMEFRLKAGRREYRFHRAAVFVTELRVPYRTGTTVLDGRLSDWENVSWVRLGNTSGPPASIRAVHHKNAIVLGITVPNPPGDEAEETAFPDALQIGFARRQGQAVFSGDFLRLGLGSGVATGVFQARDRTPGHPADPVAGVYCAARRTGNQTVYEVELSKVLLHLSSARSERHIIVSLAFPVGGEAGTEEPEPARPAVNTFAYQARYGGEELVPVHFLELVLEPR